MMELHFIPNVRSEYSKRAFGIFRTKNSSQWKALPGNNSLNLIWFIYSIYIRPILQNVYYQRRISITTGPFFICIIITSCK